MDNAFEYFLSRRGRRQVELLERNPSVSGFMQALLEHLVDYAQERGIPFERVVLEMPRIEGYTGDEQVRADIRVGY